MRPPVLDFDFSSYSSADGPMKRKWFAYDMAFRKYPGPEDYNASLPNYSAPPSGTEYDDVKLLIYYVPRAGNSIVGKGALREIREFEGRLLQLQSWVEACASAVIRLEDKPLCNPGLSFVAYAWPTVVAPTSADWKWTFRLDGRGSAMLNFKAVVALLKESKYDYYDPNNYFPLDTTLNDNLDNFYPAALRSQFTFHIVRGMGNSKEITEKLETLFKGDLYELLTEYAQEMEYLHIYYAGSWVENMDFEAAIVRDLTKVVGSFVFILLYTWFYTGSLCVSITCLCLTFLCIPVAYVLTPVEKHSPTSLFSLFLMLGIGADAAFVFYDCWAQSELQPSVECRLQWMLHHAGKGCLATSLATSVSFVANLASKLRPLREFGLFIALCVMSAYVLMLMFFPPLVVCLRCGHAKESLAVAPAEGNSVAENSPVKVAGMRKFCIGLTRSIVKCPRRLGIFLVCFVVCSIIATIFKIELDLDIPEMLPDEHNFVQQKKWSKKFVASSRENKSTPPASALVCDLNGSNLSATDDCSFYWCSADMGDTNTSGACWQSVASGVKHGYLGEGQMSATCSVSARLVSMSGSLASPAIWALGWKSAMATSNLNFPGVQPQLLRAPLVRESWETGDVDIERVYDMGNFTISANPTSDECDVDVICFRHEQLCELDGWHRLKFQLPLDQPLSTTLLVTSPAPQLSTTLPNASTFVSTIAVPAAKTVQIFIVWGVRPPESERLVGHTEDPEYWEWDPNFRPQNPWAQRAMRSFCDGVVLHFDIESVHDWVYSFRIWLRQSGSRFPTRNFDAEHDRWKFVTARDIRGYQAGDDAQVGTKVKALAISVMARFASSQAKEVLEYKEKWDDYIAAWNKAAPLSANRAFHTSKAWTKADTELAMLWSTVETIVITMTSGFFCVLVFTCDISLSVIVVLLVLTIIVQLLFFIVVVMGWLVGPFEIISLIVFTGYALTFCLHIAHTYAEIEPDDPELKALLNDIGVMRPQEGAAYLPSSPGCSWERGLDDTQVRLDVNVLSPKNAEQHDFSPHTEQPECSICGSDTKSTNHEQQERSISGSDTKSTTNEQRELKSSGSNEEKVSTQWVLRNGQAVDLAYLRASLSVCRLGGAVLSSAVSTVGAGVFLLICEMTIFPKFGKVIICVTFLSVFCALVALPAALMVFKPNRCRSLCARCKSRAGT
jgi:hypothetical protein